MYLPATEKAALKACKVKKVGPKKAKKEEGCDSLEGATPDENQKENSSLMFNNLGFDQNPEDSVATKKVLNKGLQQQLKLG
jgi:hypothetical protein